MLIDDTLAFLLGEWRLSRSLDDHRSGALGTFEGTATFVPVDGNRGDYAESGELRWGAHTGPAFRRLALTRLTGGAVLLSFSDGRPYQELDLRNGAWDAVHDCRADRYEISTVVRDEVAIEERWRVRGPAKDYTAVTTLTRRQ